MENPNKLQNGGQKDQDYTATYGNQKFLPKLPFCPIEVLKTNYLRAIKPLIGKDELEEETKNYEQFISTSFPTLFEKLETHHALQENYIHDFWLDSYKTIRDPLPINVNPIFVLEDDPTPSRNNQVIRASSILLSSIKFISSLKRETLEPDVWRRTPLCMSQFKQLFGTCRIPKPGTDEMKHYPESKHVVILSQNVFYHLNVLGTENEPILTERELQKKLDSILKDSEKSKPSDGFGVGVLTSDKREVWAKARESLISISERNKSALELIDSALFILVLDSCKPETGAEVSKNMLCGGTKFVNHQVRWYDKMQVIVTANGKAGINFEHTIVDGHTALRFVSDVFTDTIVRFAQLISGKVRVNSFIGKRNDSAKRGFCGVSKQIKRVDFEVNDEIEQYMKNAEARLADDILSLQFETLEFTGYGNLFIKQNRFSPDAFVQVAIQAAYFSLYGNVANVYESVLTKRFKLGRTEAARCATLESNEFVRFFFGKKQNLEDKKNLLKDAVQAHVEITKCAAKGEGVDRTLLALRELARASGEKVPDFFNSLGYKTLSKSVLSTSNCGNPSLRFFGFGPVCQEGFGIGYIIKEDSINFTISTVSRNAKRYSAHLFQYLEQVHDMLVELEPTDFEQVQERLDSFDTVIESNKMNHNGYDFFGSH
eukprot:snap_masked-scaffold_60-processed-gene-0.28-mRNA-1 protein AED:0.01 eAED:0.01 QI:87/1/1/1/1/1/3/71/656